VRISVTHATVYRYSNAVQLEPHTFRLRPRQDGSQRLLQHALSIAPAPAGQSECLDQDGNMVVEAWFDQPTHTLSVESMFNVETLRANPFDFLLREYSAPVRAALAPYLREPAPEVRAFAASIAGGAGHTLDFLNALNRSLAREFRYEAREDGAAHAADLTLRSREGSCRDLAVLFCDAARAMGIAARFVSGYECASANNQDSYMHAWAEVYLPGIGWRGYDPSRGIAVSNTHVAVAAGFDPDLASPVAGWYSGGSSSQMEASLALQVE